MVVLDLVFRYMEANMNKKQRNAKSDLFVFHLLELFQHFDVTMLDEFKSKKQRYEDSLKHFYGDVILKLESNERYLVNLLNYTNYLISLNMVDKDAFRDFKDNLEELNSLVSV